jgi:membrane-associated PAP2 superfamily phosphatase
VAQVRTETDPDRSGPGVARSPLFNVLIGLTALDVLLQGLWAGLFLRHGGHWSSEKSWVDVHGVGGQVAIVLALAAFVTALVKLRARRDLWVATLVLLVGLVVEAFLGGSISDGHDGLTVIHVPLAMMLMGLVVWLPLRARRP